MVQSVIGLYKTGLVHKQGLCKKLGDVEFATLEWVDWFNRRRLVDVSSRLALVELEDRHYRE